MGLKKCIIIGAGASRGYVEKQYENEAPPTGQQVLAYALSRKILTTGKYPKFLEALGEYCSVHHKDETSFSDVDVEDFLAEIATKLETITTKLNSSIPKPSKAEVQRITEEIRKDFTGFWKEVKESRERTPDVFEEERKVAATYQCALGESWYLMFELFRDYSAMYKHRANAYETLARFHLKEDYDLISLNYDVLFELAANASRMTFKYPNKKPDKFRLSRRRVISVAKVHGSINWLNSYSSGISIGSSPSNSYALLNKISGLIYSNRINVKSIKIEHPSKIKNITLKDLLQAGNDYVEPALLPPIGMHKDYNKVEYFSSNWKEAERMVQSADEIILIGTSLRETDIELRKMIKYRTKARVDICVVGSKPLDGDLEYLLEDKLGTIRRFKDFKQFSLTIS